MNLADAIAIYLSIQAEARTAEESRTDRYSNIFKVRDEFQQLVLDLIQQERKAIEQGTQDAEGN